MLNYRKLFFIIFCKNKMHYQVLHYFFPKTCHTDMKQLLHTVVKRGLTNLWHVISVNVFPIAKQN